MEQNLFNLPEPQRRHRRKKHISMTRARTETEKNKKHPAVFVWNIPTKYRRIIHQIKGA